MCRIRALGVIVLALAACQNGSGSSAGESGTEDGRPTDADPGDGDVAPVDPDPGDTDPGDTTPGDAGDSEPPPIGPYSTVTVGDPPDTCEVYEFEVPVQTPDWMHYPEGHDIAYDFNPPAGGPSYEMWAAYDRYDEPLEREHWVHNLRHGAIVLVYRPDAPAAVVDALAEGLERVPAPGPPANADCRSMGIMTPDPELDDTFAVLSFGWMMTSNCVPRVEDIQDFAERHIYRGAEGECYDGAWPVRPPCYRFEDVPRSDWTREVPEGTTVSYGHHPPTSGPYYPRTLAYGRYDEVVDYPYWMGILVRGGIVVLYRPDAPAEMIAALETAYDALPPHWECGHSWTAMVQDPTLDPLTPFAFVGFNQYLTARCFQGWELRMFVSSRRGWGPLRSCEDGDYVP